SSAFRFVLSWWWLRQRWAGPSGSTLRTRSSRRRLWSTSTFRTSRGCLPAPNRRSDAVATSRRPADMARYAVLGATSWGVTLASLLHRNGHEVAVVARNEGEARAVSEARGLARLPEVTLAPGISVVVPVVPAGANGLVVAVPAQALRESVAASAAPRDVPVLSAAKGIEHSTTLRMS